MSFFNTKFKSKKVLINVFAMSLFIFGFIFGCVYYFYGTEIILDPLSKLFFVNKEGFTNDYNFYIAMTSLYIILALFISTSFLGAIFNSFIIFTKAMHIAVSSMYIFCQVQIPAVNIFTCYLPQLLIELALIYVISIISLKLSMNSFMVSFIVSDNFNSRKIINYILDYLIVILIILTISMLFRVYLI